jgi:hypothetical protein
MSAFEAISVILYVSLLYIYTHTQNQTKLLYLHKSRTFSCMPMSSIETRPRAPTIDQGSVETCQRAIIGNQCLKAPRLHYPLALRLTIHKFFKSVMPEHRQAFVNMNVRHGLQHASCNPDLSPPPQDFCSDL